MFLLHFVPDAFLQLVINGILITGAVSTLFGYFLNFIPLYAIKPYRTLLQILGIILLLAGVYFKGGVGVEMEWRERVKVAEEKVAKAEAEAKEANSKIQIKIVEKIKVVKEKQQATEEKIKQSEEVIDAKCTVVPEALNILNDAAKSPGVNK